MTVQIISAFDDKKTHKNPYYSASTATVCILLNNEQFEEMHKNMETLRLKKPPTA